MNNLIKQIVESKFNFNISDNIEHKSKIQKSKISSSSQNDELIKHTFLQGIENGNFDNVDVMILKQITDNIELCLQLIDMSLKEYYIIDYMHSHGYARLLDPELEEKYNKYLPLFTIKLRKPKTKRELIDLIEDTIEREGDECDLNWIDVSNITDMSYLFGYPSEIGNKRSRFNGDISKWDVSNVENMGGMFRTSSKWSKRQFNGDLSNWDVSNVTNMSEMFKNSTFNGDLSKWDVSSVENMGAMFEKSDFNGDISQWNVSNVKDMYRMFNDTIFNKDISKWNVSNVKNMYCMFSKSKFNRDISKWNVSNVETMQEMFYRADFNRDISQWNVSNVKNMNYMFARSKFNGDISQWNVSKVTTMECIFAWTEFNGDIDKWNIQKNCNIEGFATSNNKLRNKIKKMNWYQNNKTT